MAIGVSSAFVVAEEAEVRGARRSRQDSRVADRFVRALCEAKAARPADWATGSLSAR